MSGIASAPSAATSSNPPSPGISMSRNTTCGRCLRITSSASSPSRASPSMSSNGCAASSFRNRERAEASSSTINALMGMQGYHDGDFGAASFRACADDELRRVGVQRAQTLTHVAQADAGVCVRAQTDAVVLDGEAQALVLAAGLHAHVPTLAHRRKTVADRVLEQRLQ